MLGWGGVTGGRATPPLMFAQQNTERYTVMADMVGSGIYSKEIDGETVTVVAQSAADHVRYAYDGWTEQKVEADMSSAKKTTKSDSK